MDDPLDREWKVVRYKIPRSRRVMDALSEGSLSAPGRTDATRVTSRVHRADDVHDDAPPETVVNAAVENIMADKEMDEEVAHREVDHEDVSDEEPADIPTDELTQALIVEDPIDDV